MNFEKVLTGGHPNSLGRTEEVVRRAGNDERLLDALFDTLQSQDEVVRMRAGDALEKVCREHPSWLHRRLDRVWAMGRINQPSVQWHTSQILSQLELSAQERRRAIAWHWRILDRTSDWIVISEVLKALSLFARTSPVVRRRLPAALKHYQEDSRPAVSRRARKLLAELGA